MSPQPSESRQSIERARSLVAAASARRLSALVFTLLAVELLDELAYGAREAAWPLIRRDLELSYAEIGLLIGVPGLFGSLLELPLGVLGDGRARRALMLWGGAFFAAELMLAALGQSFAAMLAIYMLMSPASGAFVGLSQAALMDAAPARREQNMARWGFAGSLGQVGGSLAVSLFAAAGLGWRALFAALALAAFAATLLARRNYTDARARLRADDANDGGGAVVDDDRADKDDDGRAGGDGAQVSLAAGFAGAWRALRRREVVRWLALIELANLMLDIFLGFIALYFVDVVGVGAERAALAVAVWTGVGLAGDFLVIPLVERVRGLSYLRASAAAVLVVFPAFLLLPGAGAKLVPLALLGLLNSGWYSILAAQLYASIPDRSGTVLTLHSAAGLVGALIPVALGLAAARFGLGATMWLLLAAPVALVALVPRAGKNGGDVLG